MCQQKLKEERGRDGRTYNGSLDCLIKVSWTSSSEPDKFNNLQDFIYTIHN